MSFQATALLNGNIFIHTCVKLKQKLRYGMPIDFSYLCKIHYGVKVVLSITYHVISAWCEYFFPTYSCDSTDTSS